MKVFKWLGISMGIFGLASGLFTGYLWFATAGEYKVPQTAAHDTNLPVIELNNYRFHAEAFGNPKNPVIIILHGGPGADYRYLYSLKPLADKYYLVFYDQRSSGLSPRQESETITLKSFADDLDAFVNHFGKGQPVFLLGHSWGAMLASAYIGLHPEKVEKAILAEPGFLTAKFAEPIMNAAPDLQAIVEILRAYFESRRINVAGDSHAPMDYFHMRMMTAATMDYYCNRKFPKGIKFWRGGYAVFQATAGRMMSDESYGRNIDFRKGVDKFTGQTLFIASECNTLIGVEHQKKQVKLFPNAQLAIVKNSGHMMFNERQDYSLNLVRKFFK